MNTTSRRKRPLTAAEHDEIATELLVIRERLQTIQQRCWNSGGVRCQAGKAILAAVYKVDRCRSILEGRFIYQFGHECFGAPSPPYFIDRFRAVAAIVSRSISSSLRSAIRFRQAIDADQERADTVAAVRSIVSARHKWD